MLRLHGQDTLTSDRENGRARRSDGCLDVRLTSPAPPAWAFAAGWSGRVESTLALVARKGKIALPSDVALEAEVDMNGT